jgi:hypothetical protein
MNTSNELNYPAPMLEVKYKDDWFRFYTKIDYDNWVKIVSYNGDISEHKYYKGLGNIYNKK